MVAMKSNARAFTLIELLVVLAIMATLMTIVAPRYLNSVDKAKEAALKTNLRIIRESIDKYKADTGSYPESLAALAQARYIRSVPMDPVTEKIDAWILVPPPNQSMTGVYDVHSSAEGNASDGKPFNQL